MTTAIIIGAILTGLAGLIIILLFFVFAVAGGQNDRIRALRDSAKLNLDAQKTMSEMLNESIRSRFHHNDWD